MKKNNAYRIFKHFLFSGTLLASSALCSLPLFAQQGTNLGNVLGQSGGVSIGDVTGGTNVNITGDRGYINWGDFNINAGQTGNFNFNNGNGVILNHVTGGSATSINGLLSSNGNVYVINPNGLTVGSTGVINTQGFVGTTMNITQDNLDRYVNGSTDTLNFTGGNGGTVVNNGTINAAGGSIVLMGDRVVNVGNLTALNGNVDLIAAGRATIVHNAPNHPLITIGGVAGVNGGIGVLQEGNIAANAARLQAVGGNVYALAINNTGTIRANAISTEGGRIYLKADSGIVQTTGSLMVDAASDGTAGTIGIEGGTVTIAGATVAALGTKSADNGVRIASSGDTNIQSSVIATTDADIDIEAKGNVAFGTHAVADNDYHSTMVNAYGTGDVNVTGGAVTLKADTPNAYISVGSNKGTTNLVTTAGNLELYSTDGGYAQVGYHFRDNDDRIFSYDDNDKSLFSGFDPDNRDDMARLADLYIPTGDINVNVKNDLIIHASYADSNQDDLNFVPGAHIGHAYLASDKAVGVDITKYASIENGSIVFPVNHELSGDTTVKVGRDVRITSEGASIARVGHNVRNFVSLWDTGSSYMSVNDLHGDITLSAGRDITITAKNGGTAGIGHVGDDFNQSVTEISMDVHHVDAYKVTAGRHTILNSNGTRQLQDGETWRSIAQIGSNMMGDAAVFSSDGKEILSGGTQANVVSLSGANVILAGTNGGTSVIGHQNSSKHLFGIPNGAPAAYHYGGVLLVGYGFNRYKEIDTKTLVHSLDPEMLKYYNELKSYFNGKEEGYLSVDANSRIGKEYDIPHHQNDGLRTFVGIFGFRMMRDGVTDAIRLEHGAQLGAGKIDTSLSPGQYDDSQGSELNFLYNLGLYPGNGVNASYDPVEYYGYTYADYLAGNDPLFDILAYTTGKTSTETLRIFYPSVKSSKPDIPRWEEPRYPWIPAWFDPCCVPCCVPCCDPCDPCCDPCQLTTTCCDYLPESDADAENNGEQTPTLAPPQPGQTEQSLELPAPPTLGTPGASGEPEDLQ